VANERKLKDDQEEQWRANLILRDVARGGGQNGTRSQNPRGWRFVVCEGSAIASVGWTIFGKQISKSRS
jgi:hypothetical protein